MVGRKHVRCVNGKGKASRWPCTVCKEECSTDAIFCEECFEWTHYTCDNLSEDDFRKLSKVSGGYVCTKCCVDQYRRFDFNKSLQRLVITSRNMKALHQAAILEQILLRSHPYQSTTKEPALRNGKIHQYSQSVVNMCGAASRVPIHVKGDGNCLFNVVSVAIYGHEAMSSELRVRTCVELVLNFAHYKNHPCYKDFRLLSPELVKACQMGATDGEYSSIFTAQGLSSVIGREIVSVYPAINGMLDSCVRILNTIVSPRIQQSNRRFRGRVYVLWTRMNGPFPQPQGQIWLPNHFVPLIGKNQVSPGGKTSSPVSVDSPSPHFIESVVEDVPSPINPTSTSSPINPPSKMLSPVSFDSPSPHYTPDHSVSDCKTKQES